MSKEIPYTNDIDQFGTFSKVQIDPFLTDIFQKIHLYNELLSEQPINSKQINDIINELDGEWRHLMHQTVMITGVAAFIDENSLGSNEQTREDFYEDHEMEFGGVFPVRVETVSGSDQYIDDELCSYKLGLRLSREGLTKTGERVFMNGTAKLENIVGIEFPEAMSVERAQYWLEYYMLDQLEDINVALLNSSKEECEMVMRLSDIEFDARLPHDKEDVYTLRTAQALNIYSNSLFEFDNDAAYMMHVSGEAWDPGENGMVNPADVEGTTMVAVDGIIWLAKNGGPENVLRAHLITRFLGTTKDDPDVKMYIPIASVESFVSSRYAYFTGYQGQ